VLLTITFLGNLRWEEVTGEEKKSMSSGNSSERSALKGVCEDKVSLHLSAHPQPRIIIKMI